MTIPNQSGRREGKREAEVVDIRHYGARDFALLLAAESRLWTEELHWDYAASARLISSCLEEKRLSGYALVKDRRVSGYCFFFYENDKALIGDLFVTSDGTRVGDARLLLDHVTETVLATPGLSRVEAQLPNFSFQDIAPGFQLNGFEAFDRRFMLVPLRQRPLPAARIAQEFAIDHWERRFDKHAAQLLYQTYRGHVDGTINDQYESLEGTARLIDNIVHHRGCGEHLGRISRLAFHAPSRKLAGALAITEVRAGTAHIPQVAVAPEFQGYGIGSAMIEAAFDDLLSEGYEEVSLTVTDLNAGAVRLYERLGFHTFRRFGAYVWSAR